MDLKSLQVYWVRCLIAQTLLGQSEGGPRWLSPLAVPTRRALERR